MMICKDEIVKNGAMSKMSKMLLNELNDKQNDSCLQKKVEGTRPEVICVVYMKVESVWNPSGWCLTRLRQSVISYDMTSTKI